MNMHAHHLSRHQVIALLEERDTLREHIRQLEEMLRPTIILPAAWRLSRLEADFLNALRAAAPGMVHRERMMIALYGLSDDAPEPKILDVYLCKVRRRLMEAQARIEIETIYGRGWRLTPESIVRFDEAVAAYRGSPVLAFDRRA
ncbi:helix-turn-helix domain-containing protein, partial [Methylorubrum rhodesianum]|uniref:helix-turn-helix domain-containing protein n=1 Tax=Methylorubrum rhodesianum TaxID=29427 RepID=UPI003D2C02BF